MAYSLLAHISLVFHECQVFLHTPPRSPMSFRIHENPHNLFPFRNSEVLKESPALVIQEFCVVPPDVEIIPSRYAEKDLVRRDHFNSEVTVLFQELDLLCPVSGLPG